MYSSFPCQAIVFPVILKGRCMLFPASFMMQPVFLQSAIQSYGQPQWGVSLLSLTAVNPEVALATTGACRKKFGHFCLDNTSLSVAAVEVIIAIGAVVVVMLLAIPCVLLEWRRKSGQVRSTAPCIQVKQCTDQGCRDNQQLLISKAILCPLLDFKAADEMVDNRWRSLTQYHKLQRRHWITCNRCITS